MPLPIVTGSLKCPRSHPAGSCAPNPDTTRRTEPTTCPRGVNHPPDSGETDRGGRSTGPGAAAGTPPGDPFAGDADRAHTLALAILPYTRDIIGPYTPIHLFDAPIHGSGKTLSARAALTPALGDIMFVSQATDDEYRKRITAQAIAGRSLFFLDNLTVPLSSAVISLAVTGAMWTDRILGSPWRSARRTR